MERNFLQAHNAAEDRLARDIKVAEEKSAADEAVRRQRQRDTLAAMDAMNKAQLRSKADTKAKERAEEAAFARAWQARVAALKEEEAAETAARRASARKVQSYQLRQAEQKARRKAGERIAELQMAAQMELTLQEQEDIFRQYADACIEEYRRQGKSTVPMELHLNKKQGLQALI